MYETNQFRPSPSFRCAMTRDMRRLSQTKANTQTRASVAPPAGTFSCYAAIQVCDGHHKRQRKSRIPSRKAAKECSPQPALSLPKGRKPWVNAPTI
jgi:hypothetical protein